MPRSGTTPYENRVVPGGRSPLGCEPDHKSDPDGCRHHTLSPSVVEEHAKENLR